MFRPFAYSLPVIVLLCAVLPARAFEPGDDVVVVNTELGLRIDEGTVRDTLLGQVLTVHEVSENSLMVSSGAQSVNSGPLQGEVLTKDVLPLDEAMAHFEQLLEEEGETADYHEALGRIHSRGENPAGGIPHFTKAIELDPETASRYVARGLCYASDFNIGPAIEDFNRAIELDGADPLLYMYRADVLSYFEEDTRVLDDYARALELDDTLLVVYISRGWFYVNNGEYELAHEDFDRALELNGDDLDALYGAAWIRCMPPVDELRDGERAVELATQLLELVEDPVSWDYDVAAAAYAEAGDFDRAIELEQQAIEAEEDTEFFGPELQSRLELYRRGEAYRETPPGETTDESFEEDPESYGEDWYEEDPAEGPDDGSAE